MSGVQLAAPLCPPGSILSGLIHKGPSATRAAAFWGPRFNATLYTRLACDACMMARRGGAGRASHRGQIDPVDTLRDDGPTNAVVRSLQGRISRFAPCCQCHGRIIAPARHHFKIRSALRCNCRAVSRFEYLPQWQWRLCVPTLDCAHAGDNSWRLAASRPRRHNRLCPARAIAGQPCTRSRGRSELEVPTIYDRSRVTELESGQ